MANWTKTQSNFLFSVLQFVLESAKYSKKEVVEVRTRAGLEAQAVKAIHPLAVNPFQVKRLSEFMV